jgi:hypothetical protein
MKNFVTASAPFASALVGDPELFVSEVDESDGSIALYRPEIAVLTNISLDHKEMDELRQLFAHFLNASRPPHIEREKKKLRGHRNRDRQLQNDQENQPDVGRNHSDQQPADDRADDHERSLDRPRFGIVLHVNRPPSPGVVKRPDRSSRNGSPASQPMPAMGGKRPSPIGDRSPVQIGRRREILRDMAQRFVDRDRCAGAGRAPGCPVAVELRSPVNGRATSWTPPASRKQRPKRIYLFQPHADGFNLAPRT